MKKGSALLSLLIIILLAACTTTGGSVVEPVDRTSSLMEALAANPTGEKDDPSDEKIVIPSPVVIHHETQVDAEPNIETIAVSDENSFQDAEGQDAITIVEENPSDPVIEQDNNVVIPFEDEEESITVIPSVPDAEDADIVPVSGDSEDVQPVIYPVVSSGYEIEQSMMNAPMAPWMMRLMIILVVIMILFTTSSAIRNAYRAPLNRIVSASIAILLAALSWVLSYIIAGPSLLYLVYLSLLGTYFVFRSTKRQN